MACRIIIDNNVYDMTDYLDKHPGGSSVIMGCAGKDATKEFNQVGHSGNAIQIMKKYMVSKHDAEIQKPSQSWFNYLMSWFYPEAPDKRAILIQRSQLTHDTIRLMFVVPQIDLKCGQHIICYDGTKQRKYTPVQSTHNSFDLIVKVYDTGGMSAYLNSLRIGDRLTVSEPVGNKMYLGNGIFSNLSDCVNLKMLMTCAGTGITPMYQILRKIIDNKDIVQVDIIYVNKTEGDVLLQDELEHICMQNRNISIRYFLTRNQRYVNPPFFSGRPTITEGCGYDLALICGPTDFNDSMKTMCKEHGYTPLIF